MNSTLSVTSFEEQVLNALGHVPGWFGDTENIECSGRFQCGYSEEWGGPPQYRKQKSWPTYAKINLALGRLDRKGLVEREESGYYRAHGYVAGVWRLTPNGKLLLGIE